MTSLATPPPHRCHCALHSCSSDRVYAAASAAWEVAKRLLEVIPSTIGTDEEAITAREILHGELSHMIYVLDTALGGEGQ